MVTFSLLVAGEELLVDMMEFGVVTTGDVFVFVAGGVEFVPLIEGKLEVVNVVFDDEDANDICRLLITS